MPNQHQTITTEKARQIARLFKKGLSSREVSRHTGVDSTSCLRYKDGPKAPTPKTPEELESAIRTLLRRGHRSAKDLASELGARIGKIREAVSALQERGVMVIELPGGAYDLAPTSALEGGRHEIRGNVDAEWTHHFGVTSDNHLCSRHSRLDVLNAAYDHFRRQGITTVFNAGNWIDGEARFNKAELVTAPGMDNQLDYLIDKYPLRAGITTHYIAGDDHEGWYAQREGIEIGNYLQIRAEKQGRTDLKYLGYAECDVELKCGSGSSVMRVLHPGGGSAYATSYTAQKIVESYQGGEKPSVLIIGHYHKAEYGYPREVHCVQAGCTQDQSLFMRKKKIAAHVGFWEVKLKQDARGIITRCAVEWFPFFDRGFYEKRYR